MTTNNSQALPPSAQLLDMIFGFTLSRAIAVAAQLRVADQLKNGAKTTDEIASATNAHPRSLYRLLRALSGAGIFSESDDGHFSLTPLSELLRSDSPESLRGFAELMADDVNFETWAQLPYSVETGRPAFLHKNGIPFFSWLEQNPDVGERFNDAMTSLSNGAVTAVLNSFDFQGITKLVDVGGGHGRLVAAVLAKYPEMKGIVFDDPKVVAGASELLEANGVAARCETVGGDFFKTAPAGGDAYILKHIIHDWSDDECVTILGHCHRGMTANGKVLIVEMVVPEPNVGGVSKFLDLQMLLFLSGRERTGPEYRELLNRAGFEMTRIVPTNSTYSVIEGVKS
jgi:hypothetical protein